jgi:hypothetical protein
VASGPRILGLASKLLDSSTARLFVFIDILALFPRFWCSAARRVCSPRPAPSIHGKAVDRRTGGLRYQTFCTCRLFS